MNNGTDDSLEGADQARVERLMETLMWMAWPRRPGFLGVPLELRGKTDDGRNARLIPDERTVWRFLVEGAEDVVLDAPQMAVRVMAEEGFLPSTVVLVPEIAPHVYLGSIIECEQAYVRWENSLSAVLKAVPEARRFFKEVATFDALVLRPVPIEFMKATDAMDACVRHSIAAIALGIAAADAQVNTWANGLGGWTDVEQRSGLARRYQILAQRRSIELGFHEEPLLSLRERIRLRNDLIHGNAIAEEQPLEQQGAGRPLVLDARKSCLIVRQSLIILSRLLDEEPPGYLAFCPEAPIEDDDAWQNARIQTGMREDSVFPKTLEKYGMES